MLQGLQWTWQVRDTGTSGPASSEQPLVFLPEETSYPYAALVLVRVGGSPCKCERNRTNGCMYHLKVPGLMGAIWGQSLDRNSITSCFSAPIPPTLAAPRVSPVYIWVPAVRDSPAFTNYSVFTSLHPLPMEKDGRICHLWENPETL